MSTPHEQLFGLAARLADLSHRQGEIQSELVSVAESAHGVLLTVGQDEHARRSISDLMLILSQEVGRCNHSLALALLADHMETIARWSQSHEHSAQPIQAKGLLHAPQTCPN